jgi:hypothetical protein
MKLFFYSLFLNTFDHPVTTLVGLLGFIEIGAFLLSNPSASPLHLALGIIVLIAGCWSKHG